jgi:hypothetical protein
MAVAEPVRVRRQYRVGPKEQSEAKTVFTPPTTEAQPSVHPTTAALPRFDVPELIETMPPTFMDIGGMSVQVIELQSDEGDAVYPVEFTISNVGSSFRDLLARMIRVARAGTSAFLDWEGGIPVLQVVVDRSDAVARRAAYEIERRIAAVIPSIPLRFRLLDQSDVADAIRAGLRPLAQ